MVISDANKPYYLHSEALNVGIGATLSQMDDQCQLRLVACRSRKLFPAERIYPVYEKEMLTLADSLKHWRHYVLGTVVKVITCADTSLST